MPVFTYEMLRASNEERLQRSLRMFRLLHHVEDEPGIPDVPVPGADVIELCFGAGCETAEIWGA
ncbi:MAG: hypothetical protein WB245_11335 [Acidimicrobiia bacterium]